MFYDDTLGGVRVSRVYVLDGKVATSSKSRYTSILTERASVRAKEARGRGPKVIVVVESEWCF
jgi:hypothetical protein